MAEPIDVALTIGGWIIAGLVTVGGVLLAHRVQENNRQKREDRLGIYEPMRREMSLILSEPDRAKEGRWLWSDRSPEFSGIISRGALFQKRHGDLKKDVDELLTLYADYEAKLGPFQNLRESALRAVWESTDVVDEVGNTRKLADVVLGHNPQDQTLFAAITEGEKNRWVTRFSELMRENGKRSGTSFEPAKTLKERIPESKKSNEKEPEFVVRKMGEELFDEMDKTVQESRAAYRRSVQAFLSAVQRLKTGLEKALTEGSVYRS